MFWDVKGSKWLHDKSINDHLQTYETGRSASEPTQLISRMANNIYISETYLSLTRETLTADTGDFHLKTYVADLFGLADFAFHDAVDCRDAHSS